MQNVQDVQLNRPSIPAGVRRLNKIFSAGAAALNTSKANSLVT